MRRFVVLVVSVAASAAFFAAPQPAAASCSTPVEELGCIENVICGGVGSVLAKIPGRPIDDLNCIE
jgi:type IV secretory pathway VirB2 component (pilin)